MKVRPWNGSGLVHALLAVLLLHAGAALGDNTNSGWTTLGAMPAPAWDGRMLVFHGDQGTLALTPLGDDVMRVRFTTAKSFGRDHSYAVVNHDLGTPDAKAEIGSTSTTLTTHSLKVTVQHAPLRIRFANIAGDV